MGKIKRRLKKQAEREEKYQPPRSRLSHPVEEWTGDMPKKAEDCGFPPKLIWVNELNDVWMETPRYVNFGWGGAVVSDASNINCLHFPFCYHV